MSQQGDSPPGGAGAATPPGSHTPRETTTGMVPMHAGTVQDRLSLLVISDRMVATHPLPDSGEITIGRAPKCDVMIDDSSISRLHAALLLGSPMCIRDLGSANGTRVRDQLIPKDIPYDIAPGDVIQMGAATVIVQRRSTPIRARRLWAHDYFEVRLEEECARSERTSRQFALARLRASPPVPQGLMQEALAELARGSDVVGEYGPNEYEILFVDSSPEEADQAVQRLVAALARREISVAVGLACFPRDGHNPDALMARASTQPRRIEPTSEAAIGDAIVADRRMRDLYMLAERVAAGSISVLILGETGVGKEVVAERVHKMSPRAAKPYLRLNCAALSETLLESELFGHERGAFTGAVQAKQGLLETADGGTIFLDEVGELPLSIQVKLLRVIEDRKVLRVGGLKPRDLDVRFIAATNRDLEAEIVRGTFRQDLFFRLNGATLVLPPLRERVSEIPALAKAFLAQAARAVGRTAAPPLSNEALEVLQTYSWPGNIRELRNVIERAVLLCASGPILPKHLPLEKMRVTFGVRVATNTRPPDANQVATPSAGVIPPSVSAARAAARETPGHDDDFATPVPVLSAPTVRQSPPGAVPPASALRPSPAPGVTLPPPPALPSLGPPRRRRAASDEEERRRIEEALVACAGNQTAAAERLGISRRTLINRLEEFGLARPRKNRRGGAEGGEEDEDQE